MLKKAKISSVKIYSDEWRQNRLAKFTASEISRLIGGGFMTYVREKVGEELTGRSAKTEVDTDATRWGTFHEADALQKFGKSIGVEFLITQQLICYPDSRFGCTPDGLVVSRISPDETEYEVEPLEIKCPPTFSNYIELYECETMLDVKKAEPKYYWQCLDQLDHCESLAGHFVVYHPDFRRGNFRHIKYYANWSIDTPKGKVFPIHEDLKILRQKKKEAEAMFDVIRTKLMNKENM